MLLPMTAMLRVRSHIYMTDRNMYRYSNIILQEMRNLWLFICHLCQELYYSEGQTQTMSLLNHSQR